MKTFSTSSECLSYSYPPPTSRAFVCPPALNGNATLHLLASQRFGSGFLLASERVGEVEEEQALFTHLSYMSTHCTNEFSAALKYIVRCFVVPFFRDALAWMHGSIATLA